MIRKLVIIIVTAVTTFVLLNIIPKFFYFAGKTKFDNKQYLSAAKYIKKALAFKPYNKDYRYYYVLSLSELKPTYSVQKEMYKLANGTAKDGAQILASDKLNEWVRNIHDNIGNNYIEQAPLDSNIIRWNKNSFPLKVYIDTSALKDIPDYYVSGAKRALTQWDKSIDFVSFALANKKSDAQIIISFKKIPDNVCSDNVCKFVAGYTNPKISKLVLKRMEIVLYDKTPMEQYFSDKEIYNTILHEIGHALGIMGHSYSTNDLMYPQNMEKNTIYSQYRSDFHYLSGADIHTLQLLYMLEANIINKKESENSALIYTPILLGNSEQIAKRKVQESLDYIKNSPELAVGYINLAGAYVDLKEYKKAIDALHKALDTATSNNEKFITYYNFAYVYLSLKKYDTALQYAELAKDIQPTQDILELIGIIKNYIK